MKLIESSELSKGIFWIVDLANPNSSKDYCFTIESDLDGNPLSSDYELNSKNGLTYNHKELWKKLNTKITRNYPFDYFPRGRVEIHNCKATIFCSPYIAENENCIEFVKQQFNLTPHNGVKKIDVVADGSTHYECFLDRI